MATSSPLSGSDGAATGAAATTLGAAGAAAGGTAATAAAGGGAGAVAAAAAVWGYSAETADDAGPESLFLGPSSFEMSLSVPVAMLFRIVTSWPQNLTPAAASFRLISSTPAAMHPRGWVVCNTPEMKVSKSNGRRALWTDRVGEGGGGGGGRIDETSRWV
jgi:hypothetical protein